MASLGGRRCGVLAIAVAAGSLGVAASAQLCTEGPPTTLGSVQVLLWGVPSTVPLPRTTNHVLQIDCEGIGSVAVHVQVSEPPPGIPARGTVVISNGSLGVATYSSEPDGLAVVRELQAAGFRVVDRAWVPGWFSGPEGVRKQSCRYATLLDWVDRTLHGPGPLCALGSSAGSGEIAYALTTWGLGDALDVAVFTGGPPMARFDLQCPNPPPHGWVPQCEALTPAYGLECGQPTCFSATGIAGTAACVSCSGSPSATELHADSVLHPGAVTHFPTTRCYQVVGAQDCRGTTPSALLFRAAVTSEDVLEFVPGTPHSVLLTAGGREAIVRALLGTAACDGPATLTSSAWPAAGGEWPFDVAGPPGGVFALVVSGALGRVELPGLGWWFLAGPLVSLGAGVLDGTGAAQVRLPMPPPGSGLEGAELFGQAWVERCLSNVTRVRVQSQV